jgi:hypothetical protein
MNPDPREPILGGPPPTGESDARWVALAEGSIRADLAIVVKALEDAGIPFQVEEGGRDKQGFEAGSWRVKVPVSQAMQARSFLMELTRDGGSHNTSGPAVPSLHVPVGPLFELPNYSLTRLVLAIACFALAAWLVLFG